MPNRFLAREGMPDLYGSIVASRSDAGSIGCPCDRIDPTRMTPIEKHGTTFGCIPYVDRLIAASRSDAASIRRPRQIIDAKAMMAIHESGLLAPRLPDLDASAIAPRSNGSAVG